MNFFKYKSTVHSTASTVYVEAVLPFCHGYLSKKYNQHVDIHLSNDDDARVLRFHLAYHKYTCKFGITHELFDDSFTGALRVIGEYLDKSMEKFGVSCRSYGPPSLPPPKPTEEEVVNERLATTLEQEIALLTGKGVTEDEDEE